MTMNQDNTPMSTRVKGETFYLELAPPHSEHNRGRTSAVAVTPANRRHPVLLVHGIINVGKAIRDYIHERDKRAARRLPNPRSNGSIGDALKRNAAKKLLA